MKKEYIGKKYHIDGKVYYFNFDVFNERFDEICRIASKTKKDFVKDIAEHIKGKYGSTDTVLGWRKKKNSPQTLDDVKKIATFFDTDYMRLLIADEEEERMDKEIVTDAKYAARIIYSEFCDLIDSLGWEGIPDVHDVGPHFTNAHIRDLGLKSHEDYRHHLKGVIKKATLDLTEEFRNELNDFVDECIGPVDYEYPMYQYLSTEEYQQYRDDNNLKDNDETRYIYSANHIQNMYDKLDVIFKDYICQ